VAAHPNSYTGHFLAPLLEGKAARQPARKKPAPKPIERKPATKTRTRKKAAAKR
jgi:excinuclease ABC subunit A